MHLPLYKIPAFLLDVQKQQEDSDKKIENKKERGIT
jgi:hypothetical protein